jgi:hypothetical protein
MKGKHLLPLQTILVSNCGLTLTVKGVLLKAISWKVIKVSVRLSSEFNTSFISQA